MRTADRQLGLRSAYFVLCFAYYAVLLRNTRQQSGRVPDNRREGCNTKHKAGANPQRSLEGDHIFFVRTFKISSPNSEQFPDQTMLRRVLPFLLAGCWAALLAPAAMAQYSNLDTVEGPSAGEETTLMVAPHPLTEDVSGRALGVKSPNDTRFALTLIGVPPKDSIDLTLAGEALPIEEISRPAENEIGPTRVYLSQKAFLMLADRSGVRLHIGGKTTSLPNQMRKEMRKIFETVV